MHTKLARLSSQPSRSGSAPQPLCIPRRTFLQTSAVLAAGWFIAPTHAARRISPNERLNLGVVGVSGRGGDNLREVASENIVALCDVDDLRLSEASRQFPSATRYTGFRRMMDQEALDAVVVSTPDHTHAVVAMAALRRDWHVYCEKPLTRTVSECRAVTNLAAKRGLVTQLGTQIHAGNNYRRVVELVQSGAIGAVAEVHVWVAVSYGGKDRPVGAPSVPTHLHYDEWLGPVAYRPYHPDYLPAAWRNWWAFGGGALADFGCHFMDLPFWALDLKYPLTVEPVDGPPVHAESTPPWGIVRYTFPARATKPPVALTWYHGGRKPDVLDKLLPEESPSYFKSGVLFVGDKGYLVSDYGNHLLLPEKDFKGFIRPAPSIPNSIGHHKEWIQACKQGKPETTCHFGYSGPLTETALLGNVAYRVGRKLDWDAAHLKARKCADADAFIQHQYRKGWRL